jgi:hypothetical protein
MVEKEGGIHTMTSASKHMARSHRSYHDKQAILGDFSRKNYTIRPSKTSKDTVALLTLKKLFGFFKRMAKRVIDFFKRFGR